MHVNRFAQIRSRQSGAALLVALMMLVVVMMLGVAATQITLMNEKSSRNDRDRQIAFQAAEAALRDGEMDLADARGSEDNFPAAPGECGRHGIQTGLCRALVNAPLWRSVDFRAAVPSVEYGRFTGRNFPAGAGTRPARPPRYLVELLASGTPDANAIVRYRVTAVGFGARETTQVMLQSIYAMTAPSADRQTVIKTGARRSWRELGNEP